MFSLERMGFKCKLTYRDTAAIRTNRDVSEKGINYTRPLKPTVHPMIHMDKNMVFSLFFYESPTDGRTDLPLNKNEGTHLIRHESDEHFSF